MVQLDIAKARKFPTSAGILFGLGLGGFFDGIVLHQVLQWHHMLSSWYPVDSIESLELNTLWDGIFHSTTYLFLVAALFILWRTSHRNHIYWSNNLLSGTLLAALALRTFQNEGNSGSVECGRVAPDQLFCHQSRSSGCYLLLRWCWRLSRYGAT